MEQYKKKLVLKKMENGYNKPEYPNAEEAVLDTVNV